MESSRHTPREPAPETHGRSSALGRVRGLSGKAIRQYRMIGPGDRLLVGLSGGTDSLLLVHVLEYHRQRAPFDFGLVACTVDMGFEGFDRKAVAGYAREQDWDYRVVTLPGTEILEEKQRGSFPCGLCSRLRRGTLYSRAREWGCTKLVLGQHLDDACTSFLMSLFHGQGITTMGPNVPGDQGRLRVIRPFCLLARSVIETAAAEAYRFPEVGCCDASEDLKAFGDRAYLERLLDDLDTHFPNIRSCMRASLSNLQPDHLYDPRFLNLE